MAIISLWFMINIMIRQQKSEGLLKTFEKKKSNLFPERITQLTSTSYQKFINKKAKVKYSTTVSRRFKETPPQRSLIKPRMNNVTLDVQKRGNTLHNSQAKMDAKGKSADFLGKGKKTYHLNFIKSKTDECKEFTGQQARSRPMTLFQFNESFFYDDLNLIKRKKKSRQKSHFQPKVYRIKSQQISSSSVLVVEPRMVTRKESQAINNFFGSGKNIDDDLNEVSVVGKNTVSTYNKNKSFIKRSYLSRQVGKDCQYSPFKRQTAKKDHFIFGLYSRPSEVKSMEKLINYHDFLWKINYSNGVFVKPAEKQSNLKFYIGSGNNSNLIKSLMRKRFWWTITDSIENCNFAWSQLKSKSMFSYQRNLQKKDEKLWKNDSQNEIPNELKQRYEKKIFNARDFKNWYFYLENNEQSEEIITQKTFKKRTIFASLKRITKIEDPQNYKVHNHFIENGYLGNKKALFYLMKNYYSRQGKDVFTILPLTFHISRSTNDPEWKRFQQIYEQKQKQRDLKNENNIWIIKPGESSNQGKGINVYHELEDIRLRIKSGERNKDGSFRTFIIQKYIENPLLYYNRKFDIRHFLLMTCVNGIFKAYWYEQGYVRTSSSSFSLRRGSNLFVHLTNDAVQKNSKDYGRFEEGNKVNYQKMNNYMRKIKGEDEGRPFFDRILPRMKEITVDAVKATYLSLDKTRKENNFELFGLDFMIDSCFQPWLIQINTNPCLETSCPLLNQLIPQLLDQSLRIGLDTSFPPPDEWPCGKKIWTPDSLLDKNKFQLIFDESTDGREVEAVLGEQVELNVNMGKVEEQSEIFESEGRVITEEAQ